MVCIYCGKETEVYNSRPKARVPSVWRRRRCIACVAQFTTLETANYSASLIVETATGQLYPFSRDKLFLSINRSLEYRRDSIDVASELTDIVIGKILKNKKAPDGLLTIKDIAWATYGVLKRFDTPAGHTYKAFHEDKLS